MSEIRQDDLNTRLWSAADEMRKTMSADDYKDYLLGLVFYKNLSLSLAEFIKQKSSQSFDYQGVESFLKLLSCRYARAYL